MRFLKSSIVASGLLLHAASLAAADLPANNKARLVMYDASGNQSLDPAEPQSTSGLAQLPLIAIYDSLVGQQDDGTLVPRLATAWRYNADLTGRGLERLGLSYDKRVTFSLDCLDSIQACIEVGQRVAERSVAPKHFDGFWRLLAPTET